MLDFLGTSTRPLDAVRARRREAQRRSAIRTLMTDVEQFYMFMLDHQPRRGPRARATSAGTGSAPVHARF